MHAKSKIRRDHWHGPIYYRHTRKINGPTPMACFESLSVQRRHHLTMISSLFHFDFYFISVSSAVPQKRYGSPAGAFFCPPLLGDSGTHINFGNQSLVQSSLNSRYVPFGGAPSPAKVTVGRAEVKSVLS